MDKLQKPLRLVDIVVDKSAKRRAVLEVIVPVEGARRLAVEAEKVDQEQRDPLVDLGPDPAVGRIEGIVQIEHPCGDVTEPDAQLLFRRQPESCGRDQRRHERSELTSDGAGDIEPVIGRLAAAH